MELEASAISLGTAEDDLGSGDRAMEPVFGLCMGRSGSTLLRLILDTHPDLACPPETNIPALCSQLAVVWSLIEGAPLSLQRGDAPPQIPDAAIAGIRQTMDAMTRPYLQRRGKRLYCDKSLGTAVYAGLLTRIYPGTRFVCLYRHPMDMISSGLEACPWGLNGYGFDPYIADSPGNAVMALARYWLDGATAIAAVEEQHRGRCHRVRYEDMVTDAERVAGEVFAFLGLEQVPGIGKAVFSGEHERFGPADHKIWYTSGITQDSVGRSESLPAGLIPPAVIEPINALLEKLGYVRVDESWGTADMPASPLMSADGEEPELAAPLPEAEALADRLAKGLSGIDAGFTGRWDARMAEGFTVVIRQQNGAVRAWWHVDLRTRSITRGDEPMADADAGDEVGAEVGWSIVGTTETWLRLLAGDLNMSVALRHNDLRYCDYGENDFFVTESRISLLAALLGLPSLSGGAAVTGAQVPALADG